MLRKEVSAQDHKTGQSSFGAQGNVPTELTFKGNIPTEQMFRKIQLSLQNRPERCLFLSSFSPGLPEICEFSMGNQLYQFLLLCFGFSSAPRIFTKFMKVPISFVKRLNIILTLYLSNIFLIAQIHEEITFARNALIFLLQTLKFLKKYQIICFSTLPKDRISRNNCQLEGNDLDTSSRECNNSYKSMLIFFSRDQVSVREIF